MEEERERSEEVGRRQREEEEDEERKKERGRKETIAISCCHPLSTFAEHPQLRMRFLPRPCPCNNDSTSTVCEFLR